MLACCTCMHSLSFYDTIKHIISLNNVRKLTDNPESGNSGPKPALRSSNAVETFSDS